MISLQGFSECVCGAPANNLREIKSQQTGNLVIGVRCLNCSLVAKILPTDFGKIEDDDLKNEWNLQVKRKLIDYKRAFERECDRNLDKEVESALNLLTGSEEKREKVMSRILFWNNYRGA